MEIDENNKIGFMQGRFSSTIDGRIQSFPLENWKKEFELAEKNNFFLMEWTLDQKNLYMNPLLSSKGRDEISYLCNLHSLSIPSITGDCFMQEPFWKADIKKIDCLKADFNAVVKACSLAGIKLIVVPLVDSGRLENSTQENTLIEYMRQQTDYIQSYNVRIIFESDFEPIELARFIDRLNPNVFGINYDIGNSAAMGYYPQNELSEYGRRILNVHVKDRVFRGTTVPLGSGAADFVSVFEGLKKINYQGNYILQTARAADGDHVSALVKYKKFTLNLMRD